MKKLLLIATILLTVVACTHGNNKGHDQNGGHNTGHNDGGHNTH